MTTSDWCAIVSAGITFIGIIIAILTFNKGNRTTLLLRAFEIIQATEIVDARTHIFDSVHDNIKYFRLLSEHNKTDQQIINETRITYQQIANFKESGNKVNFENWSKDDDYRNGELLCRTFDLVGVILEQDKKAFNFFAAYWSAVIIKSYNACRPLIKFRREKDELEHLWDRFENLYQQALYRINTVKVDRI